MHAHERSAAHTQWNAIIASVFSLFRLWFEQNTYVRRLVLLEFMPHSPKPYTSEDNLVRVYKYGSYDDDDDDDVCWRIVDSFCLSFFAAWRFESRIRLRSSSSFWCASLRDRCRCVYVHDPIKYFYLINMNNCTCGRGDCLRWPRVTADIDDLFCYLHCMCAGFDVKFEMQFMVYASPVSR